MTGQKLESTESLKTGLESPEKNIIVMMARIIIFYSPRSISTEPVLNSLKQNHDVAYPNIIFKTQVRSKTKLWFIL